MPPKKNNNNNKSGGGDGGGGKKHKKDDDDFDALLAQAVKETKSEAAKNIKAKKEHQQQHAGAGDHALPVSLAAKEKPVPSSSDHPENRYPAAAAEGLPRQTWPEPTIPVSRLYGHTITLKGEEKEKEKEKKDADTTTTATAKPVPYPAGDVRDYPPPRGGAGDHTKDSAAERRADEAAAKLAAAGEASQLSDLRHAAEVHREVRLWAQQWVKPGMPLMLIADRIEKKLEQLIEKDPADPTKRGQAFPTGVSLNHVAAHYTPNTGDEKVLLGEKDVIKIDFGTHVNGRVVDSAWSMCFDPQFQPLLDAVRAATYAGVQAAGVDVCLGEVGEAIQEVMESHECEINGKTHTVRSIRNLSGHNLEHYIIHGGKSVPIVKSSEATRMQAGELFAIETFGSINGRAQVVEGENTSHYMMDPKAALIPLRSDRAKQLLHHIQEQFSTLAFCRKWLDRGGQDRHLMALNQLVEAGAVNAYPELVDVRGSYSAQYEHTIFLREGCKEVVSWGQDY